MNWQKTTERLPQATVSDVLEEIKTQDAIIEKAEKTNQSIYQEFFEFMDREHGLILLDSQMQDIIAACKGLS